MEREGGGAYSFVACISHLTIGQASLSTRRGWGGVGSASYQFCSFFSECCASFCYAFVFSSFWRSCVCYAPEKVQFCCFNTPKARLSLCYASCFLRFHIPVPVMLIKIVQLCYFKIHNPNYPTFMPPTMLNAMPA